MKNLKLTKCVTTIGPSSFAPEIMEKLIKNGSNCFRINMSHGEHELVRKNVGIIKAMRTRLKTPLAIMLDTKGPEIRSHKFKDGGLEVKMNDEVIIDFSHELMGHRVNDHQVTFSIDYNNLPKSVMIGNKILVDDGKLTLTIKELTDKIVTCKAANTHFIKDRRGINLPGQQIYLPFLSNKDKADIKLAVDLKLDFIAASFVQTADNIKELKSYLHELDPSHNLKIISKIESQCALSNFADILSVSDGIMFARGDLGVDIPKYLLPSFQMELIHECLVARKFIIIATQMLDSMTNNNVPTRAEVTDVFWASLLGASCTMLSGESANGDFPIESISMMSHIVTEAEKKIDTIAMRSTCANTNKAIANSEKLRECICANNNYDIIVMCPTGHCSELFDLINYIASWHQRKTIYFLTSNEQLVNHASLLFGAYGILLKDPVDNSMTIKQIKQIISDNYHSNLSHEVYLVNGDKCQLVSSK